MHLHPIERTEGKDNTTGAKVTQWTREVPGSQHLYFTSPSVTADNRWLVFLSSRDGHPNLYRVDRRSGEIAQLTHNSEGLLQSYVYPEGGRQGLSKASPCLDPRRNIVYFIQGDELRAVDVSTREERVICRIGTGVTAYNNVSADGRYVCVPVADARAFADPVAHQLEQMKAVPARFRAEGLITKILRIDVLTGECRVWAEIPFWITHVSFDPCSNDRLIFNQEGFAHLLDNRTYCLEANGAWRKLYEWRSGEWTTHENWTADGTAIVYHGMIADRPFFAARSWTGELLYDIPLPRLMHGHVTPGRRSGEFIVDGVNDSITLVSVDSQGAVVEQTLCRHDSSFAHQDSHPHPVLNPDGSGVIFTSSRSGRSEIYEVHLTQDLLAATGTAS